jgi:TonB family protein
VPALGTVSSRGFVRWLTFQIALILLILSSLEACVSRSVSDGIAGAFADQVGFETKGYDWSAYATQVIRRIRAKWDIPALAASGFKGQVTVRFVVRRDGQVESPEVLSRSSLVVFDAAAVKAVLHASPLPPLPPDFSGERERVTVVFFYNMKPPQKMRGSGQTPPAAQE